MIERPQRSILHLAPHTGGGVGTVLRAIIQHSYVDGSFSHMICTLESLNDQTKEWCDHYQVAYQENCWDNKNDLLAHLARSDIVHIHWWNHPQLHALLSSDDLPEMRTILWAHVNGLFVPQIFFDSLLSFPDYMVLATPCSLQSPLIDSYRFDLGDKLRVIQSSAGVPERAPVTTKKPESFLAGYIGTVDYSKMHPDFISLWTATGIQDPPLIVCGGPSSNILRNETVERGVAHLFDIRGMVSNVHDILSSLLVFVYPLNPAHYGTGEQVLIEAMAYGAVPVVMNNGCEKYLVKDGKTGIVASSNEDFVNGILFLKNNPEFRIKMADAGRKYVVEKFSIQEAVQRWHNLYEEAFEFPKRKHRLALVTRKNIPVESKANLLLTSYGNSAEAERLLAIISSEQELDHAAYADMPPACFSETRGSAFHYRNQFPNDNLLNKICRFLLKKTSLDECKPSQPKY